MTNPTKLPDAMPEIADRTLLVVCDSHHCRFIDVGGRMLMEQGTVDSREITHTDRQSVKSGPGGGSVGIGDDHRAEDHRLTEFAKTIVQGMTNAVSAQGIEAMHLSAPSRLLSAIKKHLPPATGKMLKSAVDGTFMKESSIDVLVRFRPDLTSAVSKLRDLENYSTKKHLPK